jgi:phage gpG-like protein
MAKRKPIGQEEIQRKLREAMVYVDKKVPHVIGTEAVKHFKNAFQEEAFDGKKWAARKTIREGGTNGQKILSLSGELGDATDYVVRGSQVIITNDKAYAEIHNDGGVLIVTPKMRKFFWAMHMKFKEAGNLTMADQWKGLALAKKLTMPQRQFIGDSVVLMNNIEAKIERDLTKILQ